MGNCLVLQERKAIRFKGTDEVKLSNPTSLKIHRTLFKCLGYEISKKRLRMVQQLNTVGVMRIRLLLSKQELIEMIKNGRVCIGKTTVPVLLREVGENMGTEKQRSLARTSALESIPEEE
ncbi:hypothetical protein KFK09_025747 [Dendrobium nobile]|uniref:Uncharacterized protein n=1 Tax=Dendrobium nobile TaxID=94219 RepID=A0A8T3A4N0_DENNO|nr:hypothetical protein KFK09_025747 [Dendrobium nobile]